MEGRRAKRWLSRLFVGQMEGECSGLCVCKVDCNVGVSDP